MTDAAFAGHIWYELCTRATLWFSEDEKYVFVNDGHGKEYKMRKSIWDRLLAQEKLEYATLSSCAIKNLLPHALAGL